VSFEVCSVVLDFLRHFCFQTDVANNYEVLRGVTYADISSIVDGLANELTWMNAGGPIVFPTPGVPQAGQPADGVFPPAAPESTSAAAVEDDSAEGQKRKRVEPKREMSKKPAAAPSDANAPSLPPVTAADADKAISFGSDIIASGNGFAEGTSSSDNRPARQRRNASKIIPSLPEFSAAEEAAVAAPGAPHTAPADAAHESAAQKPKRDPRPSRTKDDGVASPEPATAGAKSRPDRAGPKPAKTESSSSAASADHRPLHETHKPVDGSAKPQSAPRTFKPRAETSAASASDAAGPTDVKERAPRAPRPPRAEGDRPAASGPPKDGEHQVRPERAPRAPRPPRPEGEGHRPADGVAKPERAPRAPRPPRPEGEVHAGDKPERAARAPRPPRPDGDAATPADGAARSERAPRPPRPEGAHHPPATDGTAAHDGPHARREGPPRAPRPPRPDGDRPAPEGARPAGTRPPPAAGAPAHPRPPRPAAPTGAAAGNGSAHPAGATSKPAAPKPVAAASNPRPAKPAAAK
jgi:hypothetical protein